MSDEKVVVPGKPGHRIRINGDGTHEYIAVANRFRFRAWDPYRKIILLPDTKDDADKDEWYGGEWEIFTGALGSVQDGWILMQSTGLCDKNGKEIFESDILLFAGSDHFPRFHAAVKWVEDGFMLVDRRATRSLACWIDTEDPEDSMVVVGNIYEHPELIK